MCDVNRLTFQFHHICSNYELNCKLNYLTLSVYNTLSDECKHVYSIHSNNKYVALTQVSQLLPK